LNRLLLLVAVAAVLGCGPQGTLLWEDRSIESLTGDHSYVYWVANGRLERLNPLRAGEPVVLLEDFDRRIHTRALDRKLVVDDSFVYGAGARGLMKVPIGGGPATLLGACPQLLGRDPKDGALLCTGPSSETVTVFDPDGGPEMVYSLPGFTGERAAAMPGHIAYATSNELWLLDRTSRQLRRVAGVTSLRELFVAPVFLLPSLCWLEGPRSGVFPPTASDRFTLTCERETDDGTDGSPPQIVTVEWPGDAEVGGFVGTEFFVYYIHHRGEERSAVYSMATGLGLESRLAVASTPGISRLAVTESWVVVMVDDRVLRYPRSRN
jgi:hypothetical protein